MALVTTGGGASVETGLTASAAQITNALDSVDPSGQSATWDGLVDAANLLDDDRSDDRDKVVVLFTAAPNGISSATPARAETAMRQAGAELDAVYMQRGADVEAVVEMVATLGGSSLEVVSEEDLDKGFEQVADQLAGRFRTTFSAPAGNAETQELTLSSGKASTTVEYAPGAVRAGAVNLAPSPGRVGGGVPRRADLERLVHLVDRARRRRRGGADGLDRAHDGPARRRQPGSPAQGTTRTPTARTPTGTRQPETGGHGAHPEAGGGLHRGHGRTPGHPGEARGRPGAGQPAAAGGRGPVLRRGRSASCWASWCWP